MIREFGGNDFATPMIRRFASRPHADERVARRFVTRIFDKKVGWRSKGRALFQDLLSESKAEYFEALSDARKGVVHYPEWLSEVLKGVAHDSQEYDVGFEAAFLEWAASTRVDVIMEDLDLESYLAGQQGQVARDNAEYLLESGLQDSQDRQQFFHEFGRWVEASVRHARRRNAKVADQALAEMRRGKHVCILMGTAHFGIAQLLKASGASVTEPNSSTYRDLPQASLLVAEIVAGAALEQSRLRTVALEHIVFRAFSSFPAANGVPKRNSVEMRCHAIPLASRWTEGEVFALAKGYIDNSWQEQLRAWILKNGTVDDQRFFGVAQ